LISEEEGNLRGGRGLRSTAHILYSGASLGNIVPFDDYCDSCGNQDYLEEPFSIVVLERLSA